MEYERTKNDQWKNPSRSGRVSGRFPEGKPLIVGCVALPRGQISKKTLRTNLESIILAERAGSIHGKREEKITEGKYLLHRQARGSGSVSGFCERQPSITLDERGRHSWWFASGAERQRPFTTNM